ncbi:Replication factor C, subunit RFC3 [Handroanthus impetiginosus]|uniref:Replication factor C, subunit RFC3 n=1 Tax=Handroanthus impetiginosus TaxID=429701 RepID=A0A2G9GYS0_9LAMI|nr:Replication factor C, subunit RFC3 [Handroanthus impetiginosus]
MPSPAIPRSKSASDITSPHSLTDIQPSSKSIRSTRSTGSPLTSWPKKFGEYIKGKTKRSDLTEESLQEFNRRNALIEARYNTSSPYYKGLTDFSLVINREKPSGSSPGRESHATGYVSSGSKSSFVVKVQEWGSSCFTSKRQEKGSSSSGSSWIKSSSVTKSSHDALFTTSSSLSSSKIVGTGVTVTKIRNKKNDPEPERKKVTFHSMMSYDTTISSTTEKPLRERDSKQTSTLPLPPPLASPPESLPYPLPQIMPPTSQALASPQPTVPHSNAPPQTQVSCTFPAPSLEALAPPPQTLAAGRVIYEKKEMNMKESERIYTWADKYRPFWLRDFLCNRTIALGLQSMVSNWHDRVGECHHFIFEGNRGVGKRTMIWALLREAFGQDKVQAREECQKFNLKGEAVRSILVNLLVSPRHVEINLSELKGYEKHVIVELVKEKTQILSDTPLDCNEENCKAIILYGAEKLSSDTLPYIKWMLEKFKGCNKVFFCCSDATKLQAIKPICTHVQLLEPSIEEILEVLAFIAKKEGIQLPHRLANKIANNSKNNLRQAIRSFEATWHFNGCSASLTEDQDIKTGWEDKIANIARNVLEEQSPKQLYDIRGELQNLVEHNVAPEFIFQTLKEELKKILPEHLQLQFDDLYDAYQENHAIKKSLPSAHQQEELGERQNDQKKNVHQFMRIEEFIARFMSWYKGLTIKNKEI